MLKRAAKFAFALSVILLLNSLPVCSKVFFLEADFYQDKTQERKVILGKGEIIHSDNPIVRVAVSDPQVVDLQILNEKQIFLRAKQLGISTFLAWEKDKTTPSRFDISVWPDIDYLTKQLHELDENIVVEYIPPSSSLTSDGQAQEQSQGGQEPGASGAFGGQAGAAGGSSSSSTSSSQSTAGKIILKGEVENAEVIARSLQIAGVYVGDQGIKIISQPGGQIVDGLAGKYDISSNSDTQLGQSGQGSATSFGARDPIRFTSNRYANLSRGVIATTQKGSVISFLTVKNPPQVSVAIRFYEISRSVARNLGFNANFGGSTIQGGTFVGGNGISQTLGSISSIANISAFMAAGGGIPDVTLGHGSIAGGSFLTQAIGQGVTGVIFNPDNGIGAIIQALQERGEIKTLAEPNLVIANGEPASFLAGGEVPILRSVFTAGGASTDVTYEPFGIKFNVLPTITSANRIYLQLVPEIRDIDNDLSNFVSAPGSTTVRPPAFRTRRTQTQVELESGQAFAISGLLREDNTRNLRKVPGIGDIPILGTLFRSKSFRKGETELLIVVSPQIVRATEPQKIANLTKPDVPYHDFDQMAPLKPYIKPGDEKGPDMKTPLDAGKYNEPQSKQIDDSQDSVNNAPPTEAPPTPMKLKESIFKRISTIKKIKKAQTLNPEREKRDRELAEAKLVRYQQYLKEVWQQEVERNAKAQEAMRLARQNKAVN